MLRFDDLALRRGPLLLLEHVDLALHAGWRRDSATNSVAVPFVHGDGQTRP